MERLTGSGKHTSLDQVDFAALGSRDREDIFKPGIPVPELVTSALFGLDPLPASVFFAGEDGRKTWVLVAGRGGELPTLHMRRRRGGVTAITTGATPRGKVHRVVARHGRIVALDDGMVGRA